MAVHHITRKSYHHGDLETALIATAIKLIKKNGPANLSLREVALELGVSPSAAYHYFPDKDSIIKAIGDELFEDLTQMEEAAVRGIPGTSASAAKKRFREIGRVYFNWAKKQPHSFQLMYGGFCSSEAKGNHEDNSAFKLLSFALDDLVATGAMPKSSRKGGEIIAWSGVHGVTNLIIEGHLPESALEIVLDSIEIGLSIK